MGIMVVAYLALGVIDMLEGDWRRGVSAVLLGIVQLIIFGEKLK